MRENGWGKEHVRRLETYSAAIFHLVTEAPGLALVWSYRPMETYSFPKSNVHFPQDGLTESACERDEGEMILWKSELFKWDQAEPNQVYEVVYQGR